MMVFGFFTANFFCFPREGSRGAVRGCEIVFFLLNMLVAPLSPHIVQRTYIATSDADMRLVVGAMLLAPFIAQTPGIIIGLTKTPGGIRWDGVNRLGSI